jgi:3-oxoacyl-[acyl-carrier protein] reductase
MDTPARMPCRLDGYRVVVAGGSRGIGRAIALGFARAGATVSACARGRAGLADLQHAIEAIGGTAHVQPCDLADPAAITNYIDSAAQALGGIDVLVNNATGYGFADDDESWAANVQIDLMAAVRASRAALPHLRQSGRASILHTSSIAALRPRAGGAPYAAIKAALSHYTGSQALALAPDRIRVNAIAPGSVSFPGGLWERRRVEEPALHAATLTRIPFGRFGTPEEIAHVALFLASPWAGWITGQTLAVDGGQMLTG